MNPYKHWEELTWLGIKPRTFLLWSDSANFTHNVELKDLAVLKVASLQRCMGKKEGFLFKAQIRYAKMLEHLQRHMYSSSSSNPFSRARVFMKHGHTA